MLYTIGHSTHDVERVVDWLASYGVTAVADVRSVPFSRAAPQFSQRPLREALRSRRIAYVFLGEELGGRSVDPDHYESGKIRYDRLATSEKFHQGIARLRSGTARYCIALMCAEGDPLRCHRSILVCRHLRSSSLRIAHILSSGALETHEALEQRLLRQAGVPEGTIFPNANAVLERAYDSQGERIAYRLDQIPTARGMTADAHPYLDDRFYQDER
jgi:uncharacterized protein (DUF488 family)